MEIIWDKKTWYLVIFHCFGFLWNLAFISYFGIFVIGCSCAIWYFNYGKGSKSHFPRPILTSTWWALRYHLGSLALGAFILALVWLVKIILAYIIHYTEGLKKKGIESKVVDIFLKCMMCYVTCFERFIKFLSTLGFI